MIVREAKLTYKKVGSVNSPVLDCPAKVSEFLRPCWEEYADQEQVVVIPLSRKNRPIKGAWIRVALGTANASLMHPREVFRPAIMAGASAIIVAHNHPSGDPAPSTADIRVTRQLREAAAVIQIDLIDHIICGEPTLDPLGKGYYSFNDAGLL